MKEPSHALWKTFYDHVAFAYDAVLRAGAWLRLGSEERIRLEVVGKLAPAAGANILEVGCGTASNREFLPAAIHYVGMDISRNMLKAARAKCTKAGLGGDFVQADAAALPFLKDFADLILAMGVMQHTRTPETAIKQIEGVAKPNARILIIDERRSLSRIQAESQLANTSHKIIGEYFVVRSVKPNR